ncbi:DUF2795 domain-containing protein [Azospirillum canadense]|uniref:DUF2795 domain-containing protein n=1 Tax=Azospirillum canadense TaxID=403962 RepID=UPI00222696C7|nr:DUF2795 domain-containing protein [Azospirillum canadense]MCW2237129.1 hypothetical protein [Azospirillum canadense]
MAHAAGGQSPINVTHVLKGIDFPASKQDLVKHAQSHKADDEVLDTLKKMPDQEYGTMADVMKGYGQAH